MGYNTCSPHQCRNYNLFYVKYFLQPHSQRSLANEVYKQGILILADFQTLLQPLNRQALKRSANGLKSGWWCVDFQPLVEWLVLKVIVPTA